MKASAVIRLDSDIIALDLTQIESLHPAAYNCGTKGGKALPQNLVFTMTFQRALLESVTNGEATRYPEAPIPVVNDEMTEVGLTKILGKVAIVVTTSIDNPKKSESQITVIGRREDKEKVNILMGIVTQQIEQLQTTRKFRELDAPTRQKLGEMAKLSH
ncbi:Uncharacterised protein [Candidatus Gugararchaeum adminiculabundum]|nr:Uncharacterised protein [Candidatus Gugararchaeum adminiculabundum]